jgi:hypothetical protein
MTPDGLPPHPDSLLYPTPRDYGKAPTVKDLQFFFLMSPDYGESAAVALPDGNTLVVVKNGRLEGVVPCPHPGTYNLSLGGSPEIFEDYLTEQEANARIASIFERSVPK